MSKAELKRFKNKGLEELANELELSSKFPYKNIGRLLKKKLKILLDAERWRNLQIFPKDKSEKLPTSIVFASTQNSYE